MWQRLFHLCVCAQRKCTGIVAPFDRCSVARDEDENMWIGNRKRIFSLSRLTLKWEETAADVISDWTKTTNVRCDRSHRTSLSLSTFRHRNRKKKKKRINNRENVVSVVGRNSNELHTILKLRYCVICSLVFRQPTTHRAKKQQQQRASSTRRFVSFALFYCFVCTHVRNRSCIMGRMRCDDSAYFCQRIWKIHQIVQLAFVSAEQFVSHSGA